MLDRTATEALDAEIAGVDLLDLSHRDVQRLLAAAAAVPPPRQRLDIAKRRRGAGHEHGAGARRRWSTQGRQVVLRLGKLSLNVPNLEH